MKLAIEIDRIITIQTVNSIPVKFSKISLGHLSNHFYICIQKLIDVQTNIDHNIQILRKYFIPLIREKPIKSDISQLLVFCLYPLKKLLSEETLAFKKANH